jgi:hypothetical protein
MAVFLALPTELKAEQTLLVANSRLVVPAPQPMAKSNCGKCVYQEFAVGSRDFAEARPADESVVSLLRVV